ncbi:cysteine desulfurase, mitochondrial [Batrachochytrium salamandrivorans]|nr:cysteine desulfurase, mitochondrial [Batrachochytrium salamandrivorans]
MRQTALARLTALTGPAEQFRGAQSLFRTAGSSVWASRNSLAVYSCASVTAFGLARKSAYFSTTFMPATRSTVHCHATSSHLFHTSTKAAVIAAINSDSSAAESGSSTVISSFSDAAKTSADPVKADTKDSPSSLLATAAAATTPMDPRVLDKMMPYMTHMYGNPHSRTHQYGWESEAAVEAGREEIANLVGADPKEIIFTSGATESNNLAIKGVARFYKSKKRHIITTQTEHKCVLDSCRVLSEEGFDVTFLPVMSNGLVDLKVLEAAIRPDTSIVSVMTVNNEIGVIQPIKEIGRICREHKVFFHTDAAQAVGKIPIDVNDMNIDLMSISGHKIYGPKGIGALYVRRRPRVRLEPLISGGGQERGLRSGTVPTPLVVGFGEACRLAKAEMETDGVRIKKLSDRLIKTLTEKVRDVVRNGAPESSYPGCVNLSFAYVEGESLLMALKAIALSSGSACTSASLEPSYVLRALGADDETAHSSIRFGIGRFTTDEEVDFAINEVLQHVERLREMSPLWEMVRYFGRNGGAM